MRDRNLLLGIRWGVDRYDPQRLCGGYSSGLRGVEMSFMYSNFPLYGNGVWVFGTLNKQTEFLFYAEYGDLYLDNGKRAWNRTDYERAVKQKCRKLRKEKGYDYFTFDNLGDLHRKVRGGKYTTPASKIINFPMSQYLEKCK